jgi:nitroreductase
VTEGPAPHGDRLDPAAVDHVLTTTRAVRRRLDLDRPVDNQLLLDCIDIAEQAPTGGNLGSRRWIIVRDPAVKQQIGDLYRERAGTAMATIADRLRGTGHPQEKVMASAAFLAEHLSEVPALVIPTIIGRHDGSGRPGLFDSVIQAAWSFCLALRARGLGTTWVTAALQDESRVKEILGIPDHLTEIVLLPVAWTKGLHFEPAPRHPARSISYFDRFGVTAERGPGPALRFEDGPGVIAEIDIDAPAAVVWTLVTDVDVATRFSEEATGATWRGDRRGVGAVFDGHNRREAMGAWTIPCFVDAWEEQRSFGWRTADPENPGARWRFDLEPAGTTTRLRYSFTVGPGPSGLTAGIERYPDKEHRILSRRLAEMRENMQRTVDGIRDLAERETEGASPGT